jgi:hypothetical protein
MGAPRELYSGWDNITHNKPLYEIIDQPGVKCKENLVKYITSRKPKWQSDYDVNSSGNLS